MHKVNAGYTLLVRLLPDREAAASALIADFDVHPERLPFAKSTTTHFATLTLLPAQTYRGDVLPATLMLATSFCGPARDHVAELVRAMGDALRELLQHCEGFGPRCSDEELEDFIHEHRHADTFYSGMQHLSPDDVQRHRKLRETIEAYIEERQERGDFAPGTSAVAVRREIQDYVRRCPELAWAQQPFAPTFGAWLALHWRSLIAGAIALPFLATLLASSTFWLFAHDSAFGAPAKYLWLVVLGLVAIGAVLVGAMREAEREQRYVSERQPDAHVRALAATQNRPVVNEFVIAGPVKEEGLLRPLVLRLAYWIVARAAEGVPWSPIAALRTGINIPTVATARWIASDRGRRLVFISSYTNSAEPYVRDFIDVDDGAMRINLTFGFGRGYPTTRWIVDDGALTDPNGFIHVVTENQRPTGFWYGPYRDLSIDNIKLNRKIREGLFADDHGDEDAAKAWLHLL